jgi:hypothetical protein
LLISPARASILVTIALYVFVGIEIAKRRRILRSISSHVNSTALDETIPPAAAAAAAAHDSCGNSTTAEYDNPHHSGTDDSPSPGGNHKYYTPSTTRTLVIPSNPSSLSFRQYILMPLFFFLALLLVWVAPSTNRVAAFIDPSFSSYPLMLVVGVTGSLRGFWNGIVFVVVGMRSWKRRRESDEMALRPVTRG